MITKPAASKSNGNGHKPSTGPKLVALYARMSGADQSEYSIEQQLADDRRHAENQGYQVVEEYVDDTKYRDVHGQLVDPGGWRTDRPSLLRMMNDGRAGRFSVVIGWKQDRLFRGIRAALFFKEWMDETGIGVETSRDNFDVKYMPLLAAIADLEREAIQERLDLGRRGRAQKGLWHGGSALPVGYHYEDGLSLFDEEWRPWLKELKRRFMLGDSYNKLGRLMPPPPGYEAPLPSACVRRILLNPFYGGKMQYKGELYKGQHAAVFEWEEWELVMQEAARRSIGPRQRKEALFRGILRCGICGATMVVRGAQKREYGDTGLSYGCSHTIRVAQGRETGPTHKPYNFRESKLLWQLETLIRKLTPRDVDDFLAKMPRVIDHDQAVYQRRLVEQLRKELEALRHDLRVVTTPTARGLLETQAANVQEQIDELESEIRKVESGRLSLERTRAAMLAFVENPGLTQLPRTDLRLRLRDAFPVLYVANGQIVDPPAL